jgi:hypothetical protein
MVMSKDGAGSIIDGVVVLGTLPGLDRGVKSNVHTGVAVDAMGFSSSTSRRVRPHQGQPMASARFGAVSF